MAPGIEYERILYAEGHQHIAGIDEAGRGCWAGPVVAAAVVFPPDTLLHSSALPPLDDSKALTAEQRNTCFEQIINLAVGVGVGIVPAYLIDAFGIVPATRLAMTTALLTLPCPVDALLIDAVTLHGLSQPQQAIVRGDASCYSIAAASIIAKVTRDRLMTTADRAFPDYGFAQHKGYGTALHRRALGRLGPCALHRATFRPVLACRDT
jgi:ribonuclease HII